MSFRGDRRAQSVQLGAIILFGFIIIAISGYQATVVPNQNSQIEFEQSQVIREDMSELRNQLQQTGVTGESSPVGVQLGTQFPPRTIFINPPPMSGTIQTRSLSQANVTLVSGEVDGTATNDAEQYWKRGQNFTAKLLIYDGSYREYNSAADNVSVQLGHVVASYQTGQAVNVTERPRLVSNDRVTLILVQGSLSRNGVNAVTVDPESISQITRRETLSGVINVTLPTTLPPNKVRGLLEDSDDVNVRSVTQAASGDAIRVELNGTIQLGVAAVDVGSGTSSREFGYIDVESRENITEQQSGEAVVEIRDQFGNPLGNQPVNISIVNNSGNARLIDESANRRVRTDPDGQVNIEYEGVADGDITLQTSFDIDPETDPFSPSASGNTSVRINVDSVNTRNINSSTNGTGGTVNPPGSVQLVGSFRDNPDEAVFTFDNTGGQKKILSRARVAFYYNQQGNGSPTEALFVSSDNQPTVIVGGNYEPVDGVEFPTNETVAVCLRFSGGGNNVESDFFIINLEFKDGATQQYFVRPDSQGPACEAGGTGGPTGDELPNNAVAFDDSNNNGVFDSGDKESYTQNQITGNNPDPNGKTNLVIAEPFTTSKRIDLNVNTLSIRSDITISPSGNSDRTMDFQSDGNVRVASGATLTNGNDGQIEIRSTNGQATINGATFDTSSGTGNVIVSAVNRIDATATEIMSGTGNVDMETDTNTIQLSDATIAGSRVDVIAGGTGSVVGNRTNITTGTGERVVIRGDKVTMVDGRITSPGKAEPSIEIRAESGALRIPGTIVDGDSGAVRLESNGDMDIRNAFLDSGEGLTASLGGDNRLLIDGVRVEDNEGEGATLSYTPSGVTTVGTESSGTVKAE